MCIYDEYNRNGVADNSTYLKLYNIDRIFDKQFGDISTYMYFFSLFPNVDVT